MCNWRPGDGPRTGWIRAGLLAALIAAASLVATPSDASTYRTISFYPLLSTTTGAVVPIHGVLSNSPVNSAIAVRRKSGTSWVTVAWARTSTSGGAYARNIAMPSAPGTYYYDVYAPGTSTRAPAVSVTRAIVVRAELRVAVSVDSTQPNDGYSVGFSGAVRPYVRGVTATLQRQVGTSTTWTSRPSAISLTEVGSIYGYDTPTPDQVNRYRVVVAGPAGYISATSPTMTVTAHPLVPTPTGFEAYPNTAATKALLSWDQIPGTDPNHAVPANDQTIMIRRKNGSVPPTSPADGSLLVDLPANQTSYTDSTVANGATYTYSIFLENTSGFFSFYEAAVVVMPNTPRPVAASWAWPTATQLDAEHGQVASVSCPTATFCASVDNAGAVATYDGSKWSSWTPDDYTSRESPSGVGFRSVSCTSSSFCLAVDGNGGYSTFDGATWSAPAVARSGHRDLGHVSCVSPTFCVAHDDLAGVITYNGTSWSAPVVVLPSGDSIEGLVCQSTSFCLVGDFQGNVYKFNGTAWSGPTALFPPSSPGAPSMVTRLTCPTSTFCFASNGSYISTFDGTSWSAAAKIPVSPGSPSGIGIWDLTCVSPSFCAAVDGPDVYMYDGTSWTRATSNLDSYAGLGLVSCGSVTKCVAIGYGGESATYDGSTWTMDSGPLMDRTVGPLQTLSCPTDSYCMSGEVGGEQRTYNGLAWSALSGGMPRGLFDVSCVSSNFCGGSDGYGQIEAWNGSSWHNLSGVSTAGSGEASCVNDTTAHPTCFEIDASGNIATYTPTAGPTALMPTGLTGESFLSSCLIDDFCVYVGYHGHTVVQTPSLTITTLALGGHLSGISCVSDTFCMAVDSTGYFWTYNGSTWSAAEQVNYDQTTDGVACSSPKACVMTDFAGGVRTWDGQSWSERTPEFPNGRIWDVSCPLGGATCTVVGENAGYEAAATVAHP